ncbi:MAG: proline--tRNA ligase [Coriobacteriales bacterium]|jgi:prolyl-tRNA synthetase|nr:proline--tRNA ligase [Coriobacteriales bacterium]
MPLVTPGVIKLSSYYFPTLKEDPVDAEIVSHRLLIRGAFLRKVLGGCYAFLPLGMRVLRKIEQIIREEMDAIGCTELLMGNIQPGELWHESGRWDDYGPELMRLENRNGTSFVLGPTHEELITSLVRNELRSYKELPKSLYHINWKYRDEIRPRFGLLRAREFIMKDAYSFHDSAESLNEHYQQQSSAYARICERLGLDFRPVEADSGQIGGKVTTEYMALAEVGEAELVYCESECCGFAANTEVASVDVKLAQYQASNVEKIHTPIEGTITALANFLGVSESATVKALSGRTEDGSIWVVFVPGSHELALLKAEHALPGFSLLDDEAMLAAGLIKGYMGPVGLPNGVKVAADESLRNIERWVVGANELHYHYVGAKYDEDFSVDLWADFLCAKDGDICKQCGATVKIARGIEVGQVFQLGTKYSESMHAYYMSEDGSEKPFLMGCYGWGVTRSLAAVVEQHNDSNGIIWPMGVCPAEVCVIALAVNDEFVEPVATRLADELAKRGIEVALDDRNERPGVKFNDADLIGWPLQLIVGKRGLENGKVELKVRDTLEKSELSLNNAADEVAKLVFEHRAMFA